MPIFAVQYTYDHQGAARDALRPAHRHFLGGLETEGTLLASGPYTGPTAASPAPPGRQAEPDGAFLLVRSESADDVAALLDTDPFAAGGLISLRTVRPWNPVFGPWR